MTAMRRWAWVPVLFVGLALSVLVLVTLVSTHNPNFVPSMILLGATVIPATFVTFAAGRTGRRQVPAAVLAAAALFGGVIGTVTAGWLEYDVLRGLGVLPMLLVGLIEETAKLIAPIALLGLMWRRLSSPADGIVIGVTTGMGFAALETMGYAFVQLINSQGNIGAVEQLLFQRGLLAPAGHAAWTGLICGALWRFAVRPGVGRALGLLGTFVAVVLLHTAWDTFGALWAYIVLGVISVGWLLWELRRSQAVTG